MPAQIDHKTNLKKGGAGKRLSGISANSIFLACNFGNKRVKGHFDRLKRSWEAAYPVRVYLSDKVAGEGARDLWEDITQTIKEANLAIFDVTYFRPNVILELGFALANKQARQIVICRDLTPGGRTSRVQKKWLLSNISHLGRIDYKLFKNLDGKLLQHVARMSTVRNFDNFIKKIERKHTSVAPLYVSETLGLLIALRDKGPISRQDFKSRLEDRGVDAKKLGGLLMRFNLAKPTYGSNGVWKLVD